MHAHHGVLGLVDGGDERVAVSLQVAGRFPFGGDGGVVVVVAVDGAQPVGEGPQRFGQVPVGGDRVGPGRVAAVRGQVDRSQHARLRGAVDEGHVGVPAVGPALLGVDGKDVMLSPEGRSGGGVRGGEGAEEGGEAGLGLVREVVLVAEEDHLVGEEGLADPCERVPVQVGAERHTGDPGADAPGESTDGRGRGGHGGAPFVRGCAEVTSRVRSRPVRGECLDGRVPIRLKSTESVGNSKRAIPPIRRGLP